MEELRNEGLGDDPVNWALQLNEVLQQVLDAVAVLLAVELGNRARTAQQVVKTTPSRKASTWWTSPPTATAGARAYREAQRVDGLLAPGAKNFLAAGLLGVRWRRRHRVTGHRFRMIAPRMAASMLPPLSPLVMPMKSTPRTWLDTPSISKRRAASGEPVRPRHRELDRVLVAEYALSRKEFPRWPSALAGLNKHFKISASSAETVRTILYRAHPPSHRFGGLVFPCRRSRRAEMASLRELHPFRR